ncbi:MAG: S8 family serine peptidase [Anaerobacillus sp.]|uniref:S8 family serine peptidase n=1 Tax=Anaerobacillus sp. TaxID=1872506 RepID=UPI00391C0F2A
MSLKGYRKLFNSLLVFTLIFTLIFPAFGAAATTNGGGLSLKDQLSNEALVQMKDLIAQQKAALSNDPVLHPDLQNLTGDEEISVIVQLSEPPVGFEKGKRKVAGKGFSKADEKKVKDKVNNQQRKFEKDLSKKGVKAKKGFTYSHAINGMAVKVKASEVHKLLELEGVLLVEPDLEVVALANPTVSNDGVEYINSVTHLDVPAVWDLGYEGENVKVAVLDTGIDYHHPDFEGVYKGGFNFVPHTGSDYARARAFDDPYETSPLDRPSNRGEFNANGSSFYTTHGTHVAGTIAAQGKNAYGMIGLAPKIDLYAYRVLGAYGSGATSGIIAGIDKSVEEGMDIINLSLGGSSNSQIAADSIAINNATLAGVTAVIATGNSGSGRGTIGNPATAAFAISVGNTTVPEDVITAQGTTIVGESTITSNLKLMGWKLGQKAENILQGSLDLVAIGGWGEPKDYVGKDVEGKVVVVTRGTTPFVDKIAAAKAAGAKAIIIYNNAAGHINIGLGDSLAFIPAFDMAREEGLALVNALNTNEGQGQVSFASFNYDKTPGDEVNNSSSRGPSNPVFDIKPDVTAPGTNILSTVPAYKKDFPDADYTEAFDRYTGTSMATPHVAGIAALLKSQHPSWTPFDIKVAISNTAKQLDTARFDVFAQGPGRVQPLKAATTEALAYAKDTTAFSGKTYENVKGTITFGNVPTGSATTVTRDVVVKNLTGYASNYDVSVQVTKAATGNLAGTHVTVDQSSFTLTDEKTLKVTLNVPAGSASTEILGYVHITNGATSLILPFAANFAPPTGLKSLTLDHYDLSPNGDGKLDSTTLRYEFWNAQRRTYIELWDAANPNGGFYGDGYIGWLVNQASTTVGPKTYNFDGTYIPWGGSTRAMVPEGVYTVDITTLNFLGTAIVTSGWTGPLYIKYSAPEILTADLATTNSAAYELSGQIDDKYIDFAPTVKNVFGLDYDVNEKLTVSYEITNSQGEEVGTYPLTLNQDGTFNVSVEGLALGDNTVKLTVVDEAQNSAEKELTITRVDTEAPVTSASVNGVSGKNGWYTSDVTITLTATDADSDVLETYYRVADGAWQTYSQPITITEDGVHSIEFYSVDSFNNEEAVSSIEVKVDQTAPTLTITVDKPVLSPPNNKLETINVTIDSNDELSGIAAVVLESITVNEEHSSEDIQSANYGTNDTEFSLRASRNGNGNGRVYTVTYLATDYAGNTIKVTATVTVPKNNKGKEKEKDR